MPWVILAAAVWIAIIIFVRFSGLRRYWSAGLWSLLVSYYLAYTFTSKNIYIFREVLYEFHGIPLEILIALTGIGILVIRFLPEEKPWQLPYLLLISAIMTWLEIIAVDRGYIIYQNWPFYLSFFFKLIAFITITWLSGLTVKRRRGYLFK